MKLPRLQRRSVALIAVITPLLALFIYVALRSGPLAPVEVTVTTVETQKIAPALFGIGTVQARYTYKIGPTFAGRIKHLAVHVGDEVKAGQVLGEMDAVDLDARMQAQQAAIKSAEAALQQAQAKQAFALTQANRYEQLLTARGTSEETLATKRQELAIANAALAAAREDATRLAAELQALRAQHGNLRLVAPVAGRVAARNADPGTTVVAGQAVVEVIDPASLWIDSRFDQVSAEGLAAGLPTKIVLRSRQSQTFAGRVLRLELHADAVTEEILAKIVFDTLPEPLPPLGELAEVTVQLGELTATPVIPNAAIRTFNGQRGVWKLQEDDLLFVPLQLGRTDLAGWVQVTQGLESGSGERIILHSAKTLSPKSRMQIVNHLAGTAP